MWSMILVISGIFEVLKSFVLILFDCMQFEEVGKGDIRYGILGRCVKFQNATVGFVMSIPMEQLG